MDKRGRPGFVEFTLEIQIEVAEYLTQHGQKVIEGLQRAVTRYHRNLPVAPSKNEKSHDDIYVERQNEFKAICRTGYRLLRFVLYEL